MNQLEQSRKKIIEYAKKEQVEIEHIMTVKGVPIVKKGITLINGGKGSHKSRFLEMLCTNLLRPKGVNLDNFIKVKASDYHIIYLDTERNMEFQLASTRKKFESIGLSNLDEKISLTTSQNINRKNLIQVLTGFIKEIKCTYSNVQHFIICIDVLTDMINNFNDEESSIMLISELNKLCINNNCTLIGVIHQNPPGRYSSKKSRGHLGTEIDNKASTIFSLNKNKDSLSLYIEKSRFSKSGQTYNLEYNKDTRSLVILNNPIVIKKTREKLIQRKLEDKFLKLTKRGCSKKEILKEFVKITKQSESSCTKHRTNFIEKYKKDSKYKVEEFNDKRCKMIRIT